MADKIEELVEAALQQVNSTSSLEDISKALEIAKIGNGKCKNKPGVTNFSRADAQRAAQNMGIDFGANHFDFGTSRDSFDANVPATFAVSSGPAAGRGYPMAGASRDTSGRIFESHIRYLISSAAKNIF